MTVLLIGLLFVVIGTLGYWALRNAQDFSDANEIIPGVPTTAPKEWAGAHSPEARLHRRLRDAMTALRANRALDSPEVVEVREALERAALEVDDRLIAAAALPGRHKDEQVASVGDAVDAIEQAVTDVVALRGPASADVEQALLQARTRLALVQEARNELDDLAAGSMMGDLRAGIEETSAGDPDREPDTEEPGSG